jgi:hypothetical protein
MKHWIRTWGRSLSLEKQLEFEVRKRWEAEDYALLAAQTAENFKNTLDTVVLQLQEARAEQCKCGGQAHDGPPPPPTFTSRTFRTVKDKDG